MTHPLVYQNKYGTIYHFRKEAGLFFREDGKVLTKYEMVYQYKCLEDKKQNFKYVTTPNGFRVRIKRIIKQKNEQ